MKKWKYAIIAIVGVALGVASHYFWDKPNMGTFLGSDMDPSGNVYILGVNESKDQYSINKISSYGYHEYEEKLEKSTDKVENIYSNLEVDSKGNIFIVKRQKNLEAIVSDPSQTPSLNESVLMYDINGRFVKEIANMDFSEDPNPPTVPYIRKLQLVGQDLTIIGVRNHTYDIIKANPLSDKTPEKTKTFDITPPIEQSDKTVDWINDIAVLSNGRVVYSTKRGEFYAMDNNGTFLDYTSVVSKNNISLTGFGVDSGDNLYFTDAMSGAFYKMNTKSISSEKIYSIDSSINEKKEIKLQDLRKIKLVGDGDYYSHSKDFTNPYYVRFGVQNSVISDVHRSLIPWGAMIIIGVAVVFSAVVLIIGFLWKRGIKRFPLAVRITSMFLPVYAIAMLVLVFMVTQDSITQYKTVLVNNQDIGAKIASGHINGDEFSKIDHLGDYMSTPYIRMRNDVIEGYRDLAGKIGDNSDYIVAYTVKSGKIYSTVNTKYSSQSDVYKELKYADPDMIASGTVLVDFLLERDEISTMYNVWDTLSKSDNKNLSVEAVFRDVHGDLTASFTALRDSNGKAIGFVGNYLDEQIHQTDQFIAILGHSAAIILIVSFVVFAYMCLVVKLSLRPLKTLEKGINSIGRGEWNTKISVKSKDELADIAQAFNLMSEKMSRYTSNLIRLNGEYIRFVPREIFRLIGKAKITEVHLHDNRIMPINALYVTFNISYKGAFNFNSEQELFEALNTSYEEFFKIVEKNKGVVQSFDGMSAMILFPKEPQNAFNTSVQFKEIDINEEIKKNMNMTLGTGDVLIGVSGDDQRRGVIVVSDDIMQIVNIDSHLKSIGVNHVATQEHIDQLKSNKLCSYRFIGKMAHISGVGAVYLYELIDMTNRYKKDLYMNTKELFEKGVELYQDMQFEKARRLFSDVLGINEKDPVAVHYLVRCDEYINHRDDFGKYGKKWTGYLFD